MALSHSQLPRRGSPVARNQISNFERAKDYACAGFHTSVDEQARAPMQAAGAWVTAAQAYASAYGQAVALSANLSAASTSPVSSVVSLLAQADAAADAARRLSAAAHGDPVPAPIDPSQPPPTSSGFLSMQIAGIPAWLLLAPLGYLAYRKFSKKGRSAAIKNPGRPPRRRRRRRR